ncbi:uncharacterized protein DUF4403 [Pontibacter mucosus]|uniref:Uncharacterized protein DUF4403 n=1 Tax=Pontibacter mucosus TaxID=1649266 RepID=A0A2T5YTM6_9BACT|nr:DUF4403 family protein [Pontibacter mucosus]PTX22641.1 uncharacterized protein DUF4403 [Pontibacter mucosus]
MTLKTFRKLPVLLLLVTSGLALPGCSSTDKLNTAAPETVASAMPAYKPQLSSISIPISIPVAAIEGRLNQEIANTLYKDTNLNDDNLAVTVTRNGSLSMRADRDKIYFSVPLRIYAKGRWKWDPCKFCPSIDKTEDTTFDMIIKTESKIGLTEDYKVKTITSGDFEWGNTKPVLELGPLRIGLARFVEPALRQQMATLSQQLDKELQNRLDVKKYVADAWQQLQQPVKLDDNLNAWLTVMPQEVRMAPLLAQNGNLNTRLGVTSYISVTTDGKPQVQVNKNLPRLIVDNRMSDDIQIGLTASVPYAHASKLLQEQVAKQTYTFDGGKSEITVNEAAISPGGEQLVLMLDVNGKTKAGLFTKKIQGKVYLRGTPYYDAATASIRVRDVAYDLDTKDKILSAASWLAQNKFEAMIQQQVSIPVQHEVNNARKMLQSALDSQGRIHESVLLRGSIKEITPDNIYLTQDGIKAVINAKGTLTATVDKL